MKIQEVIRSFQETPCPCGRQHATSIEDVRIGSGLVHEVGKILHENHFPASLLVVATQATLKAADGILESLNGFSVRCYVFDDLRVATLGHVAEIEALLGEGDTAILSVGTGSVNDPCRLAAARQHKKLCIFATAPSMDGFASYGAPLVHEGFKFSYAAKSPEVIIGDTAILAAAPAALKSAGFGDMIAKYVGLVDWQISALVSGEYYCERIATLTRTAVDELMQIADKVTVEDEYTAGKVFEALLKTGVGMSFTQNSRPASGAEHIVAHLIECVELREGKVPNLHGDDVGVATLEVLRLYNRMAEASTIHAHKEQVDWEDVYAFYGNMAEDVRRMNEPENIIDTVDPATLEAQWPQIVSIIHSVPSYEVCRDAMAKAGCKLTVADIGKSDQLFDDCFHYSPYMRKRLTLLRMRDMITL